MTGIFSEDLFIKIFEHQIAVSSVGGDTRPINVAALTGSPFHESFKFTLYVASVIPTVATAAFPFILQIPLEAVVNRCRICPVAHQQFLRRICKPIVAAFFPREEAPVVGCSICDSPTAWVYLKVVMIIVVIMTNSI
jgi:hypothetical protein